MARGGLGGCFPGLPSSPTQLRAAGLDGDRAPDVWVLRAVRSRVCVAPEGAEMGSGEALTQPDFFPLSISPTSSPVVGEVRRGTGEGEEGPRGENSLTRPGRLPAAHSRRLGRAGRCDQPREGLWASVSPSSFPRTERAGTCFRAAFYRAPLEWLALSRVLFTSILTSNRVIIIIIYCYHHYHHHYWPCRG